MCQQVVDRQWLPCRGTIFKVGAETIAHVQFALLLQDEDRHGGKLLGGGAKIKPGMRCVRYTLIPIGHTIALA